MSSSRELGEPGSTYFREITQEPDDPTKNIGFDPESTLLISSNTDGTILAVSGVIGEDDDSFGHKFKIVTFKQDQTTHKWSSIGAPIINDIQSTSSFQEMCKFIFHKHVQIKSLYNMCNSCEYGVHAAVMPCCQKDLDGSSMICNGFGWSINDLQWIQMEDQ